MEKTRLQELYKQQIRPALQKELGLKNIMQVPQIKKIVINVGAKGAVADTKVLQIVARALQAIAGQVPIRTTAKKSIAGFKLREGMPIGMKVTLRRKKMYEFLDRLINLALPKTRDFQGVTAKFDRSGNYNLGIREWNIFPELEHGFEERIYGMNITIHTSAKKDEHGYQLLKSFGMPFRVRKGIS